MRKMRSSNGGGGMTPTTTSFSLQSTKQITSLASKFTTVTAEGQTGFSSPTMASFFDTTSITLSASGSGSMLPSRRNSMRSLVRGTPARSPDSPEPFG